MKSLEMGMAALNDCKNFTNNVSGSTDLLRKST